MCYCYHEKVIVADSGRAVATELNCNQWRCPDCGPRMLSGWLGRAYVLSSLGESFERVVFKTALEVETFLRRLDRWKCQFFRMVTDEGYEIFHQALPSNRVYEADESRWFSGSTLMEFVTMAVDRLSPQEGQRRMSCSRSLVPEKAKSHWELVAKTGLSVEEMDRRAKRAGWRAVILGRLFPAWLVAPILGNDVELSAEFLQRICGKEQSLVPTVGSESIVVSAQFSVIM